MSQMKTKTAQKTVLYLGFWLIAAASLEPGSFHTENENLPLARRRLTGATSTTLAPKPPSLTVAPVTQQRQTVFKIRGPLI
jgi:hypothetical protein